MKEKKKYFQFAKQVKDSEVGKKKLRLLYRLKQLEEKEQIRYKKVKFRIK